MESDFFVLGLFGVIAVASAETAIDPRLEHLSPVPVPVNFDTTPTTQNLTLAVDRGKLIIRADGVEVFQQPATSISELTIKGNDLDNRLVVDFVGGNPIPANSLTFDGVNRGTDFDALEIVKARIASTMFEGSGSLNADLDFGIGGPNPGSGIDQYEQIVVADSVNIVGGNLSLSRHGSFVPSVGQSFVIIENATFDAVSGTFAGLPEGALVPGGINDVPAAISYVGGDGNDVVVLVQSQVAVPAISLFGLVGLGMLLVVVAALALVKARAQQQVQKS